MTGVEILSSSEVAIAYRFNFGAFFTVLLVLLFVGICFIFYTKDKDYNDVIVLSSLMLGIAIGSIVGAGERIPTEYVTEYKVTISDEVSFNEFIEKYDIVDQEDKIYTVRERE